MAQYYNRYTDFNINGENLTVPYIKLPPKPSDKKVMYKVGQSRLDKISEQYYGTPYFGWLILQANPYVGGLEWDINDGQILIVPYPLVASLQSYKQAVDDYFFFYGKDVPMRTYSVPNIGNTPLTQVTSTSTNTSSNGNNNVSSTNNGGTAY